MALVRKVPYSELTGKEEIGGTILHDNGMRERIQSSLIDLILFSKKLRDESGDIASAVDAWLKAHPDYFRGAAGAQGLKGDTGPVGPAASALVGTAIISETALVAIAAGDRWVTATLSLASGKTIAAGDGIVLTLVPTAQNPNGLPSGYRLNTWCATGANTIKALMTTPLIALGASYSIQVKVYRLTA